jgi:hypothetical protein
LTLPPSRADEEFVNPAQCFALEAAMDLYSYGVMTEDHAITSMSVLSSSPACSAQHGHLDHDPVYWSGDHGISRENYPMGVVAAMSIDGCKLWVRLEGGKWELVNIAFGEMMVFHGLLEHSGAAYEEENVRIHMYINNRHAKQENGMSTYHA